MTTPFLSILSPHGHILYTSPSSPDLRALSLLSVINSSAKMQGHLVSRVDNMGVIDLGVCVAVFSCPEHEQNARVIDSARKLLIRLFETLLGPVKRWNAMKQMQLQLKLQLIGAPAQVIIRSSVSPWNTLMLLLVAKYGMRRQTIARADEWSGLSKNLLPPKVIEWAVYSRNAYVCGTCRRKAVNFMAQYCGDVATGMDIPLYLRPNDEEWSEDAPFGEEQMTSAKILIVKLLQDVQVVFVSGEDPSMREAMKYIEDRGRSWKYMCTNYFLPEETPLELKKRLGLADDLLAMIYISEDEESFMLENFVSPYEVTFAQFLRTVPDLPSNEETDHLRELQSFFFDCVGEEVVEQCVMEHDKYCLVTVTVEDKGRWCGVYRRDKSTEDEDLEDEHLLSVSKAALETIERHFSIVDKKS